MDLSAISADALVQSALGLELDLLGMPVQMLSPAGDLASSRCESILDEEVQGSLDGDGEDDGAGVGIVQFGDAPLAPVTAVPGRVASPATARPASPLSACSFGPDGNGNVVSAPSSKDDSTTDADTVAAGACVGNDTSVTEAPGKQASVLGELPTSVSPAWVRFLLCSVLCFVVVAFLVAMAAGGMMQNGLAVHACMLAATQGASGVVKGLGSAMSVEECTPARMVLATVIGSVMFAVLHVDGWLAHALAQVCETSMAVGCGSLMRLGKMSRAMVNPVRWRDGLSVLLVLGLVLFHVTGVGGTTSTSPLFKQVAGKVHAVALKGVSQVPGPMGDRMRFLVNDSAVSVVNGTSIAVLESSDLKQLSRLTGLARKQTLKVGDSGAAVHVVTSRKRALPGTIKPNTMCVSTANGSLVPPE